MAQTKLELVNATFEALFEEVVDVLLKTMSDDDPLEVTLPEGDSLSTKSAAELAHFVARTSNIYSKASRLAGMAKQEVKRAQHMHTYAYKINRVGKNDDERTINALKSSYDEAEQLNLAERVLGVAEQVASASKVASESARKLLDKIESIQIGEGRERYGQEKMTQPAESIRF